MIMGVVKLVEWEVAGETKVLEEKSSLYYFVLHKSHMTSPSLQPGLLRWETSDKQPDLRHGLK
jgi:hypothetical protein